jgi:hypothetical protein
LASNVEYKDNMNTRAASAAPDTAPHADPETGDVDRLLPIDVWQRPGHIALRGDRLVWRWQPGRPTWVRAGRGLLQEFLNLESAEATLRFAQKWGVLLLCRCDLPAGHRRTRRTTAQTGFLDGCTMRVAESPRKGVLEYWEPVSAWLNYVRGARAVLRVVDELRQGRLSREEDWAALWPAPSPADQPRTLVVGRLLISALLETWLEWSGAQISVVWSGTGPNLAIGRRRLCAALAVQLASAATQTAGLDFCSSCGEAYRPHRRPSTGRRNYCPSCRKSGQPLRDAARDYQRRLSANRASKKRVQRS